MNEHQRAEEHLRVIRELMERATIYRAISAPTALVGGLLAVMVVLFPANFWPALFGRHFAFQFTWFTVLLLTLVANTIFIAHEARRRGDPFVSAGMKMALRSVLPPMLVGGFFFITTGGPILVALLALFYGLALLATAHFAPHSIVVLGWAFLLAGCVALVTYSSLPLLPNYEDKFMGATFGLFHLIYAACTWPRRQPAAE